MWHRWSVRGRFTLFAGIVAALLSTLLAATLMVSVHRFATGYVTEGVIAAGRRVSTVFQRDQLPIPIPYEQVPHIQLVDSQGKVVASTESMAGRPPMAHFAPADGSGPVNSVVCDRVFPRHQCYIVVAQRFHHAGRSWIVYSAAPVVPPWVHPGLIALALASVVIVTTTIVYGSHRIISVSLAPVDAIRAELDEINATSPGRRVPVPPSNDAIHGLAESVNQTLDRLEAAMERQRQFASDASHDLRSPITAMRAEVESALLAPEEADVPAVGRSLLSSLDRLQAIVRDLLLAARLDAGTPGARDPVDLPQLVGGELDRRHTRLTIRREVEPGVVVMGDYVRLARMFANLMDNAERHAAASATIRVLKRYGDPPGDPRFAHGTAILEVHDDGAGIPPDKWEVVFQRFTRLDAARSKDAGGTGLGLSIARQIAEMSGGTLGIEPSERGARFVVRLPLGPRNVEEL
ncbi:sensor histidine kinase [Sphaerisporangium perillae]|uniref:sensor histidine kinase n=1 Tax=Sphaerisporangium perillae TaxID=2935860 RepID=UPI00200C60CC|nr:HAMP domain-containing sensor histidine kinase [Sphaerisporangium perillae]